MQWWLIVTAVVLPLFIQGPVQEKVSEWFKDHELGEDQAFAARVRTTSALGDGDHWVLPDRHPIGDLAFLGDTSLDIDERHERVEKLGGRPVVFHCGKPCTSISRHLVTLTGHRAAPVHIDSIEARVLTTRKAPMGTLALNPSQGGGPVDTVHIDLDAQDKQAHTVDQWKNPTEKVFTVEENRFAEEGEPLDFMVVAATRKPLVYEWELVLKVSSSGKEETVTVRDDNGEPFSTVGADPDWDYGAAYVFNYTRMRFEPARR
ncbi:hypothetical protein ACSNOJ_10165 [Streptomyces sp. URMC 128]|uniref:hypothetical protein n=1 Tax=Streptomyces sp. URMC 128 TaxID=3423404 RepID=UPI003F1D18DC